MNGCEQFEETVFFRGSDQLTYDAQLAKENQTNYKANQKNK